MRLPEVFLMLIGVECGWSGQVEEATKLFHLSFVFHFNYAVFVLGMIVVLEILKYRPLGDIKISSHVPPLFPPLLGYSSAPAPVSLLREALHTREGVSQLCSFPLLSSSG